jgi:dipeptidyl aminopeptidase/acylaminoacyl peptidase
MLLTCILALVPTFTQDGSQRPLTVEDGDTWAAIRGTRMSESLKWLGWQQDPADGGDGTLVVVELDGDGRLELPRGSGLVFDFDERFAALRIEPSRAEQRAWKDREKLKEKGGEAAASVPKEEPQSSLVLIELATGVRVDVPRVRSFRMPEKAGGWIAWHLLAPEKAAESGKQESAEAEAPEAEPATPAEPTQSKAKGPKPRKEKDLGTELVLRSLATGVERRFAFVTQYTFSEDGRFLAFVTKTKDGAGDGVHRLVLATGESVCVLGGRGEYLGLQFDERGELLAFVTDRDDQAREAEDERRFALYLVGAHATEAQRIAGSESPGLPAGWGVAKGRSPAFSDDGTRLYFGSAPLPEVKPDEPAEDERVVLDVWSWTDDQIQPVQLEQRQRELDRNYLAVAHLAPIGARVVQLGSPEVPEVALAEGRHGRWALGTSDRRWRHVRQWDSNVREDVWRIDIRTGDRVQVIDGGVGNAALSPTGRFATYWDGVDRHHWIVDLDAEVPTPQRLTGGIQVPLWNERHDQPSLPPPYGTSGWLQRDAGLLVHDSYDVWLVDPVRMFPPSCVTDGAGRREGVRLRRIDLDGEELAVDPNEPLLFSAFHLRDKRAGFWRDDLVRGGEPTQVLMADKRFGTPQKARGGEWLLLTREDYREFPDLWVASAALTDMRRVSNANPQQAGLRWGSSELCEWRSAENELLQGLLYKPDDFDAERRYPLIVYFYERNSDQLHAYHDPAASRSTIRYPYYTSNDYVVFVPDITYRVGFPGESCADAVLPGILALTERGFIDPERIGVQGHSWGGYQIAYLVTRTDMFAAAVSGAPVANMTSAYGGVRYGTGLSRQFQYEKTQSRLGGTLWEMPDRYIENSPLFRADRVSTPLLILHNDQDGAVPWTQGIELFAALKRLSKPVWLLNYNGEDHGIAKFAHRRDYARRMSQFFAHYLKGAPPAEWMVRGVPAVEKGRTLGLDLVPEVRR